MDWQSDINWIKSQLAAVTDPEIIKAFKKLFTHSNSNAKQAVLDWWDELSQEERQQIDQSAGEAERGE
ncbi:MAG: hypothetical protein ACFB10_26580 [Salibacteraceae bacterium]